MMVSDMMMVIDEWQMESQTDRHNFFIIIIIIIIIIIWASARKKIALAIWRKPGNFL